MPTPGTAISSTASSPASPSTAAGLRKARFTDTRLRDVRFVASDLAETGWLDTTLADCALAGVQAFSVSMRRVTFRMCKLDSVNFRSGTLTDVTFENCLLRDVEFGGATLQRVSFGGCTLTRADFAKVSCTDVDLRGAVLGITAGYESLRGATIDSGQLVALAPLIARHLGITVTDWRHGYYSATSPWCTPAVRPARRAGHGRDPLRRGRTPAGDARGDRG